MASYQGDGTLLSVFASSATAGRKVTITQASTTTAVTASASSVNVGQSVTFHSGVNVDRFSGGVGDGHSDVPGRWGIDRYGGREWRTGDVRDFQSAGRDGHDHGDLRRGHERGWEHGAWGSRRQLEEAD